MLHLHFRCRACEEAWPCYAAQPSHHPSPDLADRLVELEMDNMAAVERGRLDTALTALGTEISLIQVGRDAEQDRGVRRDCRGSWGSRTSWQPRCGAASLSAGGARYNNYSGTTVFDDSPLP